MTLVLYLEAVRAEQEDVARTRVGVTQNQRNTRPEEASVNVMLTAHQGRKKREFLYRFVVEIDKL